MALDKDFARRLDEALTARGIRKIYPLALELGVDESAISRWQQGRAISIGNIARLCDRLAADRARHDGRSGRANG